VSASFAKKVGKLPMTTYVLDSSAALRYVDNEAGTDRIHEILLACASRRAELCISAMQWGEIAGKVRKRYGVAVETSILSTLLPSEAVVVPATAERAVRAAALKVGRNLPYADAFAVDLAMDSPDHILVTADYGFKDVEDLARMEFLPAK
jgi:predicted nucleic acid-binding protein